MTNISQDQALQRWESLPDSLREALYDPKSDEAGRKMLEEAGLSGEKLINAIRVTGLVFLGFIHPDDVARELSDAAGLDPKAAIQIQDALKKSVYSKYRSELEKIYAPLDDARGKPLAPPSELPRVIDLKASPLPAPEGPKMPTPTQALKTTAAPLSGPSAPPPASIDFISKISAAEEKTKREVPPAPQIFPAPARPASQFGAPPSLVPSGKDAQTARPEGAPAQWAEAPLDNGQGKPFMIHKESVAEALQEKTPGFRLELRENLFKKPMDSESGKPSAPAAKPAQLEIGAEEKKEAPKIARTESAPRVVHYTQFRTPLESPFGVAPASIASSKENRPAGNASLIGKDIKPAPVLKQEAGSEVRLSPKPLDFASFDSAQDRRGKPASSPLPSTMLPSTPLGTSGTGRVNGAGEPGKTSPLTQAPPTSLPKTDLSIGKASPLPSFGAGEIKIVPPIQNPLPKEFGPKAPQTTPSPATLKPSAPQAEKKPLDVVPSNPLDNTSLDSARDKRDARDKPEPPAGGMVDLSQL